MANYADRPSSAYEEASTTTRRALDTSVTLCSNFGNIISQ
jgi:hypothetical protein